MKPVSKPASFNQCPFRCISGGGAVLLSLLHIIKKIVHTRGFRPREWRYLWNTQNQLTACFTPKGDCWHYTYDAFGRRLSKTKTVDSDLAHIDPLFPQIKPKITTWRYLWSGDQLIEETPIYADGTLAASQQIQWLYQPGEITPTERYQQGKLHYVVTDHQGTSREIFSEGGQASWAGRLNTWGQMQFWRYREGKAENDPNYTECPFRFAGQYEDEESGLYYNRFRYYDKETGQYLSPDPIGLLGGLNPYGYVHCPTGWVDPFGLSGTSKINNNASENNTRFLVDSKGQVLDLEYFRNLKDSGEIIKGGSVAVISCLLWGHLILIQEPTAAMSLFLVQMVEEWQISVKSELKLQSGTKLRMDNITLTLVVILNLQIGKSLTKLKNYWNKDENT